MSEKEYQDLVRRYQRDEVSDRERKLVEGWLELLTKDKDQVEVDDKVGQEIKQSLFNRIEKDKTRQLIPTWVRIAASFLVFIGASFVIWQWRQVKVHYVETTEKGQKIAMPDGSIVWLKPHSSLTYPERFENDERNINFSGEGLFEIAKDKSHPFVIHSGQLTATVLGTSFNLKTIGADMEVTVLTGKVELGMMDGKAQVIVGAHEKASYKISTQTVTRHDVKLEETVAVIANTEYDMNFQNVILSEIAKRIEKKFNVKVTFSSSEMNGCLVTGDLTDHSLEETLKLISQALSIQYKIDDDKKEVRLTGEGCR